MEAVAAAVVVVLLLLAAVAAVEWCLHQGKKVDASHANPTKAATGPKICEHMCL